MFYTVINDKKVCSSIVLMGVLNIERTFKCNILKHFQNNRMECFSNGRITKM